MTSAGTPVPSFQPNTPEQAEEFKWRMKTYEDNILYPQYDTKRIDNSGKGTEPEPRPTGTLPLGTM